MLAMMIASSVRAQEVFVPNSQGTLTELSKAVVTGNKTSGKAWLSLYGAKLTTSLVLDGKNSIVVLPAVSTIFYVFNPKDVSIQAWKMVKLKTKKKNRELAYMSTSAYSGSRTKLNEINLMVSKITDEIYELRPSEGLETGEYALFLIENGVPSKIFDIHVEQSLPPYPQISKDVVLAEFYPQSTVANSSISTSGSDTSGQIIRWYFDSDPRGARIFYRVISSVPQEVKNTNESYMTTTPLEETKSLNIPGLTYENAPNVVIEIKVTKRGYEEQVKRYNVRQALDQQEISGFFELVEKNKK